MLLIHFLRFLRGYVCFRAAEGFPERFLNLCAAKGIAVWDVGFTDGSLFGCTDIAGYKAMRDCAKRSGMVLRLQKKHGLPFFLHRYRRRVGLLIGFVLFLAGLWALSGMVWSIEVQGNARVSTEVILAAFEEQGLKPGVPRRALNPVKMSEEAGKSLPDLSWLALNLRGSSAVIEVREIMQMEQAQEDAPQNIVAAKAGQLEIVEVYRGAALAKPGQAVLQGALLASGIVENKDGSARLVHAQAYAVARTQFSFAVQLPRTHTAAQVKIKKSHLTLRFLWFKIPLGKRPKPAQGELLLVSERVWNAGERLLPLALERCALLSFVEETTRVSDHQLRLQAARQLFVQFCAALSGAQVLTQQTETHLDSAACAITQNGAALENIGLAQEIGGK
ncbi:MAG: sporulation protein YqfD [Oscillospiraceae bacterium]|jgi:similar to stage IV sporulation protein|nr:sporulation protein YqfD [Oscillospiraceae bacterium]